MKKITVIIFLFTLFSLPELKAQSAEKIVRSFITNVRSGLHPEQAKNFLADTVLAHQVISENPTTVKRTPENYTNHIREFLRLFGNYEFEITELIAQGDKVYVRWKQTGKHIAEIDGFAPTQLPLIEYTSAVYRVEKKKIVEYWVQMDRLGFDLQLKKNAEIVSKK
jgi:predicted ester cyclase